MILADRIRDWAGTVAAKHDLGWLLRRLIKETCPDWSRVEIQDGSQMYLGDFDGVVDCEGYRIFVPAGHSVWEISVRKDVGTKANEDYDGRTAGTLLEERTGTAFVFASPRVWKGRDTWQYSKGDEHEWRSVSALDARSLANWLEDAPGIESDFLRRCLGDTPSDLRTGESIWETYSNGAQLSGGVAISASFVVAGRKTQCRQLSDWLSKDRRSSGSVMLFFGPSVVEMVHFTCASAHLLDSRDGKDEGALTSLLWAKSEGAVRSLATLGPGHTVVVSADFAVDAAKLARRGCLIIVMHECDEQPQECIWGGEGFSEQSIYLPRATEEQWLNELRSLGLPTETAMLACQETGLDYGAFCRLAPNYGLLGLGRDSR